MNKNPIRWIILATIILIALLLFVFFPLIPDQDVIPAPTSISSATPTQITSIQPTLISPVNRETNYYVSRDGSDSNPGSIDKPWKTIQFAVDHVLPGDTIHIRGGTYPEVVRISKSGTENEPITLTSYSSEAVIIDGGEYTTLRGIGNVSYWIIDNLTFKGSGRYTLTIGWWDDGLTEHWIVRNNTISGANFLRGAYHIWENNNISGIGYVEDLGDAGISEGGESHHNIFRNNKIHDFTRKDARGIWSQGNTHDSIFENNTISNINASSDGSIGQCIDLDGAGNVEWRHTIRGNRISNCNYVGIQLENVFDSVVENNLIMNAKSAGIIVINYGADVGCKSGGEDNQFGDINGDCRGKNVNNLLQQNIIVNSGEIGGIVAYSVSGVKVYSNIIYQSPVGLFIEENATTVNNLDVRGNIISEYKKTAFSLIEPASLSRDENNILYSQNNPNAYNVQSNSSTLYSLEKWQNELNLGYGSMVGNPLFIDPAILNFRLQPNSPAIDAGTDLGILKDFDGKPRLSGANFDIGPFEMKN